MLSYLILLETKFIFSLCNHCIANLFFCSCSYCSWGSSGIKERFTTCLPLITNKFKKYKNIIIIILQAFVPQLSVHKQAVTAPLPAAWSSRPGTCPQHRSASGPHPPPPWWTSRAGAGPGCVSTGASPAWGAVCRRCPWCRATPGAFSCGWNHNPESNKSSRSNTTPVQESHKPPARSIRRPRFGLKLKAISRALLAFTKFWQMEFS